MRRRTFIYILIDILIVTCAFLIFIWIKPASKRVYLPEYSPPFLFFLILWIAVSVSIDKFRLHLKENLKDILFPILAGDFIIFSAVIALIYAFHQFSYSRLIVFGTIFLSFFTEVLFAYVYYYNRKMSRDAEHFDTYLEHQRLYSPDLSNLQEPWAPVGTEFKPLYSPLNREVISRESGEAVFEFINQHINSEYQLSLVVSTSTRFNIDNLPDNYYQVIINLRVVNDFKRINKFLEAVNNKLPTGGYYINCVVTNNIRKKRILKKYPPVLNYLYYIPYFIFMRIFPKLPGTKKIYFWITNGYNRAISKAEALGRLYSCGFEVLDTSVVDGKLFFVARKKQEPSFDYSPTYGPLIRLKRVGKNGKNIYVYKMRTMHPYSEYLQEYIYREHDLENGGKFRNDFRVSTLGRFMRKFWIDELPMLLNLLLGDLKIVGVRPLSKHYFDLYDDELKQKRMKVKPGLIPPFYADMPGTLEEIQESELRYLEAYSKHPWHTDWKYFWKAMNNIVIKKARSN